MSGTQQRPIHAVHACDGWRFEGDEQRWFLIRQFGELTAHIRGTTATTCSWNIVHEDGRWLAGTSELNVHDAKNAVAQWIREGS